MNSIQPTRLSKSQNLAKKKISSFTKNDLKKIDEVYASLVCVHHLADMPATRVNGVDSNTYARLVSIPTLNGLSELVKDQGVSSFKLSSSFGDLSIKSLESVNNYTLDTSCSISSECNTKIVVSVKSTGSFVVIEQTETTPTVSAPNPTTSSVIPTNPIIKNPTNSGPNLDYIALILFQCL